MRHLHLALALVLLVASSASAQISYDQAMGRLKQRQAARATQPALGLGATTQPAPDLKAAIEDFAWVTHDALRADNEKESRIDDCISLLLGHSFRLSAPTLGVTNEVPIGEEPPFGHHPAEAALVSFALAPVGVTAERKPVTPLVDVFLTTPDDSLWLIRKGDELRGEVTINRVEIDPAVLKAGGGDVLYAGKIKILAELKLDVTPTPPVVEWKPPPPNPLETITRGIPFGGAKRIVFVCRASGVMLTHFDAVRRELSTAVSGLHQSQRFGIIVFNDQTTTFCTNRPATPEAKAQAAKFIEGVGPKGESKPLPALKTALGQHPDVIVFLTDGDGDGDFDFDDSRGVLELIDRMNFDRKIKINTIAFIHRTENDPKRALVDDHALAVLQKIAKENGGVCHVVSDEQ